MATLREDIEQIFYTSVGVDKRNPGNIPEMAEQLSQAIIDWLKRQEFRITKMTATIELEKFQLLTPLQGTVRTVVGLDPTKPPLVTVDGGMLPGNTGIGTADIPVNVSKEKGGLIASGHAYIGLPAVGKPDADTTEEQNDYAVVRIVDGEEEP